MRKAVILLSGGLDSATCLAIAKQDGYELQALSFKYGQRHEFEINAAKRLPNQWELQTMWLWILIFVHLAGQL